VESGEVFGLLGTNGAGKTTTINILTGTLFPTDGAVSVGAYNVKTELRKIKEND
jgi:ABC-type multidrug transport system ATPase subunit